MKARVIVLILPVLFNCWFVRDWPPLRRVNQFSELSWKNLRVVGKENGMVSEGKFHLRYMEIFPPSGKNTNCKVGFALAPE